MSSSPKNNPRVRTETLGQERARSSRVRNEAIFPEPLSCVEPSPAQTLLQTLYRTPRTLTTRALSELHRNLTTFLTTLPEPPRNFPACCWGRTCFRKMRRDKFWNTLLPWTKSAIWSVEVASTAVGMLSPGGHKPRDDIRSEGNGASDPGHSSPACKRTEL